MKGKEPVDTFTVPRRMQLRMQGGSRTRGGMIAAFKRQAASTEGIESLLLQKMMGAPKATKEHRAVGAGFKPTAHPFPSH